MQDLSSSNVSTVLSHAGERTPLLQMQRNVLPQNGFVHVNVTQDVVNWLKKYITPVIMPTVSALNGSAIASTIITLSEGWPKDVSKVIAPAMYIGLPFNAIGFLDALAQEYKINRLNKFRQGYRIFINGTNTAIFSLQFLIAILDDIYEAKNKPFDVSNAAFAGICIGPATLGLITLLVQGFNVQRPSDLKSIKNKMKYGLLSLLDLTNNASTAHSFIQNLAALTHPLTSPPEVLLRYSLALAPALASEGIKLSEHLPKSWFSECMLNFSSTFLGYLRASPEQLFIIISALNYAIFNEEVLRNNEKDFNVTGTILIYLFWVYAVLLPLGIRLYGGLSPSEETTMTLERNSNPFGINYESDGDTSALSMQDPPALLEDVEAGRIVRQTEDNPMRSDAPVGFEIEELPFASGTEDFHAISNTAPATSSQHINSVREKSAEFDIDGNPLQPSLSSDLSAAVPAAATPQVSQTSSVTPAKLHSQHPLPTVAVKDLPLAPSSASLLQRQSLFAEAQQSAVKQQPIDTRQLKRTQSSELVIAPDIKQSNNQLRRST